MSTLPSKLLLPASLLLLGFGIASLLDDDAPWTSLQGGATSSASTGAPVDIRQVIEEEVRRQREPADIPGADRSAADIELMSGVASDNANEPTPAWLTGEIEF
jgi:hypothetical protein